MTPDAHPTAVSSLVPPRGDDPEVFRWSAADDSLLWKELAAGDSLLIVGLKQPGAQRGVYRAQRFVSHREATSFAARALRITELRLLDVDTLLPQARFHVATIAALTELRKQPFVDYVEPARLRVTTFNSCGSESIYTGNDNMLVPIPGVNLGYDIAPLQYRSQFIDAAWAYSQGQGILVGLTDTGVDLTYGAAAEWSSVNFSAGLSAGRAAFVQDAPNTSIPTCSHGSRSAGLIAAPRNGRSSVGVAYRAGLAGGFIGNDVLPTENSARNAIRSVAQRGAKVIAMPWGYVNVAVTPLPTWSDVIGDEIRYWIAANDVLFIAAAGTTPWAGASQNFIVFPARMSEVFAVSGAELANPGVRPSDVHYGPQLDGVAFTNSLTTGRGAFSGSQTLTTLGGSSGATGLASGIAALVRAKYPLQNEAWVRARLSSTGGYACGRLTSWHILLNAEAASGGICAYAGTPQGPTQVTFYRYVDGDTRASTTEEYCMSISGGVGPISVTWPISLSSSAGSSAFCRRITFDRGNYTATVRARVRDQGTPGALERDYTAVVNITDMQTDPNCSTCARPAAPDAHGMSKDAERSRTFNRRLANRMRQPAGSE